MLTVVCTYTEAWSAYLKVLKPLRCLNQTVAPTLFSPGCVSRCRPSLCCPLSGSPCRLPPGSAGQLSPSLHLLHPGHLCVCGSALHPQQREEVHHLWHLSTPRLWVLCVPSVFLSVHVPFPVFILHPDCCEPSTPQACASWLQPPSTQTASTWTRKTVGTDTRTSWRGFPLHSRSSPPSLTLCYARRRREKDTSCRSTQPKSFGWIYTIS